MLYREAGQFKTTYAADQQLFPIRQDRIAMAMLLALAFVGVPLAAATPVLAGAIDFNYWFSGVLIPFLIFSLAALGLNILTGYAGQLSLGTAAFMAVGAFAAYNFELRVPGMPMLLSFVLAGIVAALIGIVFGLPSLRIKGFYLAVATLAAQFFVVWALTKFGWLSNYSSSGVITAQKLVVFGYAVDTPVKRYLLVLAIVSVMALAAKNMVRSSIGRAWMAVRDMDVAAEVVGIPMMKTKLLAFAISSFYCGVAGALYAFAYLGTVEPAGFVLDLSFRILFMIIIGGVGRILGTLPGAAVLLLLPLFGAAAFAVAGTAYSQNEQFIPMNGYWVGPYAAGGSGIFGGFIDYVNMINARDGGVNGVKLTYEKCETEYNNARGVECYERSKKRGPTGASLVHPLSTGITYSLIDKGTEEQAQWLQIRQIKPDWVILRGWGVMNPTALKAAAKIGFPRNHIVGVWWSGAEEDVIPAGDAAKGYIAAAFNVSGSNYPVVKEIEKFVYAKGKGEMEDKSRVGSIYYNRGVVFGIVTTEAIRTAQERYGKGKPMTGDQIRWGLENLSIDDKKLKQLGATGFMQALKVSCMDHEGGGSVKFLQWDGAKWNTITDWITSDQSIVRPMIEESAAKYAKEKGITPRDCSKEG